SSKIHGSGRDCPPKNKDAKLKKRQMALIVLASPLFRESPGGVLRELGSRRKPAPARSGDRAAKGGGLSARVDRHPSEHRLSYLARIDAAHPPQTGCGYSTGSGLVESPRFRLAGDRWVSRCHRTISDSRGRRAEISP